MTELVDLRDIEAFSAGGDYDMFIFPTHLPSLLVVSCSVLMGVSTVSPVTLTSASAAALGTDKRLDFTTWFSALRCKKPP